MQKITNVISILIVLFAFGCKDRSVGVDNNNLNNNANTNVNTNTNVNDNVTPPEVLTFRIMVNETVENEMEYEQNIAQLCLLDYPDLEDTFEDNRLCRNLMTLADIKAPQGGYPDGLLRPDEEVLRAEAWHMQLRSFGLLLFPEAAPGDDVDQNAWYAGAIGNFASKGFISPDENNMFYPSNVMLLTEWNTWKTNMQSWLGMSAIRIDFLEVLLTSLLGGPTADIHDCVSPFEDIATNSFECVITNTALDFALLDDSQTNFRPIDPINWAEVIKISLEAANIPESQNHLCLDSCTDGWFCGWMEKACELGLIVPSLDNGLAIPTRLESFRFLYKMEMLDL